MAMARRIKVGHEDVFPFGAYLVSEVTQVVDFDRSTREMRYQQTDADTGLLLWQVDVLDADPDAKRSSRAVSVKIAAKVQPVPPANESGGPFTPVVFEGLTALPYVESVSETFSRVAWSFRAEGMRGTKTATVSGPATAAPAGAGASITSGSQPSSGSGAAGKVA